MLDKPKITYLLGAGASCDSLPLGTDLGTEIGKTSELIKNSIELKYDQPGMPYPEEKRPWPRGPIGKNLIDAFKWIRNETIGTTVDNFARILFIRQQNGNLSAKRDLNKVKAVLACYFLLVQSRISTDKRYDEFFGKILETRAGIRLPKHLRFLSWNYDILPEKTYFSCASNTERVRKEITESDSFIRLNGIAGMIKATPRNIVADYHEAGYIEAIQQSEIQIDIETLIELFDRMTEEPLGELEPVLKFGWESENIDPRIRDTIIETDTLIVIGYSFPDFNAEVDRQLLDIMLNSVQRIVIQVPNTPEGNLAAIKGRLLDRCGNRADSDMISLFDSKGWFYRPHSLMPI